MGKLYAKTTKLQTWISRLPEGRSDGHRIRFCDRLPIMSHQDLLHLFLRVIFTLRLIKREIEAQRAKL